MKAVTCPIPLPEGYSVLEAWIYNTAEANEILRTGLDSGYVFVVIWQTPAGRKFSNALFEHEDALEIFPGVWDDLLKNLVLVVSQPRQG